VKKLLTGIVALTIIGGSAVAQTGQGYDANGRLILRTVDHGRSMSGYGPDGRPLYRTIKGVNSSKVYDTNGRLLNFAIRRGNIGYIYDRNGRLTSRAVFNSGNAAFRMYDTHGRFISSGSR
jgi:YD repeat-containing protein